jgi:ferredoxin--NADP+ reductase
VREVVVLGRRGPAQAAFSASEVRELGRLDGVDISLSLDEIELDPLSRIQVAVAGDRSLERKITVLTELARRSLRGKRRRVALRFLVSPVGLISTGGRVSAMRLVRNELYSASDGSLRPRPTGEFEMIPVDLVFRSVGYRGVPIPGLPFDDRLCVVPNDRGRVIDHETGLRVVGSYVSGWIKRQPVGIIGTNKPDAAETVASMLEDVAEGNLLTPVHSDGLGVEPMVRDRQPAYMSFEEWKQIDAIEKQNGESQGRPRVKITSRSEMLTLLGRGGP